MDMNLYITVCALAPILMATIIAAINTFLIVDNLLMIT